MNQQYIKDTLYRLRHDYGSRGDLYSQTVGTPNHITGVKATTRTRIKVRRMIILPITVQNKFEYDLSFIAANKNFTLGGWFEAGDKIVIIDAKDLPANYRIDNNHYLFLESRWYAVHRYESLMYQFGWMLHAREAQQGTIQPSSQMAEVEQTVTITSEATNG